MRRTVKSFANLFATILVLPVWCGYLLVSAAVGQNRSFPEYSQAMSLIPGTTGVFLRRAFYRLVLPQCDIDSCISFGTVFSHPSASIGKTVYIGVGCMIGDVTLEDDVLIGSHVSVINGNRQHGLDRLDLPVREQPGEYPRINIGRDTWIGDRAVVMANLGSQCVVGAGSVVTKPVEDYAIVVGNPARVIGWRNGDASAHQLPKTSPAAVR